MKRFFANNMFLVLLLPLLLLAIILYVFLETENTVTGTWGINKTVGWAWDIFNFIQFLLYPIYLFGYGLLFLFKVQTNYKLSMLHLSLIIIPAVIFSEPSLSLATFYLTFLSLLVFIINIAVSITSKLKPKTIGLDKESA